MSDTRSTGAADETGTAVSAPAETAKATASPSPIRTTPALSPMPAIMPLPFVGSVLRSGLELL